MARPKYCITQDDLEVAVNYLKRKMFEKGRELVASQVDREQRKLAPLAEDELSPIIKKPNPEKLNAWCERWLGKAEWKQLKCAIRSHRRHEKAASQEQQHKTVVLTREAWQILHELAKSDNVTLSEFIVQRHEKEWLEK